MPSNEPTTLDPRPWLVWARDGNSAVETNRYATRCDAAKEVSAFGGKPWAGVRFVPRLEFKQNPEGYSNA